MKQFCVPYLVIISIFSSSWAFNLDVDNLVRHRGRPGSMFGFTVAQHSFRNKNWIIVGAPEDQSVNGQITKGGAVYRCDVSSDNACEQVVFDKNGDNEDMEGNRIDSKSHQWFGATLTSANGSVLACAPRYVYTLTEDRRDPVGTCWLAKDQLEEALEFSPCRNRDWGYHRDGSCEAGLGAALSKDGQRLYIGAPGSNFWQGQVHSVAATTKLPFVPPKVIIIHEGKIFSQNKHNRADVITSLDGPPAHDDTYLGYSVTSGRFDGGLESPAPSDIAAGIPRGGRLNGKIVLFTYNMTNIRNITGEQLGAYFGYAMAACDIDADGFDDLIVGAPMYTEEGNHEGFYETGRIYVFYAGHKDGRHVREGDKNNRARFGHSIACLGDVNKDGYNDFAVGAPYEKDGERGAVYIYHGSKMGVREKYSQVIRAEEIPGNPLTFGYSLAGGIDMDRNSYPDMSVGAYESDQAFLFRARPVVKMFSTVAFDSESKQISLEERNCTLKDRTRVPCVKMDACLRYEGLGVEPRLDFEIQVLLDARKSKSPRLAFLSEEGRNVMNQTVRLDKGKRLCSSYWVYLKSNIRDKLTSLDAELWYSLANQNAARLTRTLTPVLDADENLSAKDTLTIQKNCGKDNICIPDLRLIASPSVEKYVLGSGKRLEIEVEVQNEGEDAFESTFELKVPTGLNFVNIERKDESEREIPVQCSPPSFNNNYTLRCDIGNPLPRDKLVKFLVLLQPYHQKAMNSIYNFSMIVNSTNPERNQTVSDNIVHFGVPLWVVTELSISGSSRPVDVYYNSSQYVTDDDTLITKESQIGPQVAHLYTITNKGPSEFLEAKATILWPSNMLTGEPLLYLLEQPETSGDVECYVEDDEYNVRKVKIDRKGKSFFDSEPGESSAWMSSGDESDSTASSSGASASKTSSSSSWSATSNLSVEERLKFEAEDKRREEDAAAKETGDGSDRHHERAKSRVQGKNHYSSNGGRLESDSHSRGSETYSRGRTEYSRGPTSDSRSYEEESYSRHESTGESGGGRSRSRTSERTSSSTWGHGRGQGGGRTETTWRVEEDGVVRNGSSIVNHSDNPRRGESTYGSVPVAAVERTYERNSSRTSSSRRGGSAGHRSGNSDRHFDWRVEGDGMTKEADGTVVVDDGTLEVVGSKRRGGHAGSKTSEEKHSEWNTTWTSGGRPTTVERTSWKRKEDGVTVGSGDHSRTFEGTAEHSKAQLESRLKEQLERRLAVAATHGSAGSDSELDANVIGGGDSKHRKEWTEQTNTTWSTSTGGKPVTVTKTTWKIDEDGKVRTGGDTRTYEGTPEINGTSVASSSYAGGHHRTEISSQGEGSGIRSGSRPHSSHRESVTSSSFGSGEAEGARGGFEARTDSTRRSEVGSEEDSRRTFHVAATNDARSDSLRGAGSAGTGGSTYKKEWEEHYNTTWGTSTGGKPQTVATSKWKIEEDGAVRTGGDTKTYEGVPPGTDGSSIVLPTHSGSHHRAGVSSEGGHGQGESFHSETRHHSSHHSFRTQSSGEASETGDDDSESARRREERRRTSTSHTIGGNDGKSFNRGSSTHSSSERSHHFSTESEGRAGTREEADRRAHHRDDEISSSGAHTARGHHHRSESEWRAIGSDAESRAYDSRSESERRSQAHQTDRREKAHRGGSAFESEGRSHQSGGSHFESEGRSHQSGGSHFESEGREQSSGSSAAAEVGQSSGASSSFDFGAVARGPADGKARTYVTDLGILGNEGSGASSGSSSAGSRSSVRSGAVEEGASRHHSDSREKHYSFGGESGARDEGSDSYSSARSSSGSSYSSGARYASGRTYSTGSRNIEGDPDLDPNYDSRNAGSRSSSSYSWHRSYSSNGELPEKDDSPSEAHRTITNQEDRQGFRHYRRDRRNADDYDNYGYDEYDEEDSAKRCTGPVRCTKIVCTIGALKKDQEVHVAIRSRLWLASVKKYTPHVETMVGSEMTAKVTLLPTIGRPSSKTMTKNSTEVKTRIMTEPVSTPDIVPLWIVVLSAVCGALILMLLVYVLYKLGFFKRNRPETASAGCEKTPLNRNGHYQGDEPL